MWRMVIVLVIVGLCVHTAAALPGSGTQQDPWRIQSLADFDEFAADPNYWSCFTRLETDVNLAGRTYTTAVIAPDTNNANSDFAGTPFTGIFDGNDHKITNLTIDDAGAGNWYLGLFGCIAEDGEVKNLGLEGASVSGGWFVGGLVGGNGWSDGSYVHPGGAVSNCYSTGDVSGTDWYVGGLVGLDYGDVSNCFSTASVSGAQVVGGLVGSNWGATITYCYSTGSVSSEKYVGGLVGSNRGDVSNCHSTGDVSGVYQDVGGLVGLNTGNVSSCYSTGYVSGAQDVGGLVGFNWGNITNCYSTGDVNYYHEVGGLVGLNYGDVSNCYSTGSVSGARDVGGLVGENKSSGSISNCYSTGDVSGDRDVGGLVGKNDYFSTITKCYSKGSVLGLEEVGGMVGRNSECGTITASFWDKQTSGKLNMCGYQDSCATGCDPNCGKTTAEMQTRSTFTSAGLDFVEIWLINNGATYPVLRQEIRSDLNGDGSVDFADFAIFANHWLEGKDN